MPLVTIKVFKNELSNSQTKDLIHKVTETVIPSSARTLQLKGARTHCASAIVLGWICRSDGYPAPHALLRIYSRACACLEAPRRRDNHDRHEGTGEASPDHRFARMNADWP